MFDFPKLVALILVFGAVWIAYRWLNGPTRDLPRRPPASRRRAIEAEDLSPAACAAPMSPPLRPAAAGPTARACGDRPDIGDSGLSFQALILDVAELLGGAGLRRSCSPTMSRSAPAPFTRRRRCARSGPEPWRAAYVQPSRRPTDGRYGENPNRLQHYYQLQVILKPAPADSQELYLRQPRRDRHRRAAPRHPLCRG